MCDELSQVPAIPFIQLQDFLSTLGLNAMLAPLQLIPGSANTPSSFFDPSDHGSGPFWAGVGILGWSINKRARMLLSDAGLDLPSREGVHAVISHANTADRTYSLPDRSGTIALESHVFLSQFL